jgi:hypothetical protein
MMNTTPYVLSSGPVQGRKLTLTGELVLQLTQPSHITARQSINHPPSPSSRLRHRVAQARSLRYFDLYHWKRIDTLVSLHFRLSTTDREHLEAKNIWQSTLHGPT